MVIIFYYNNVTKHDINKDKHVKTNRQLLNDIIIYKSVIQTIDYDSNIYIYNYYKRHFSNIYLIASACQIAHGFKDNIVSKIIKKYPNISVFYKNCSNYNIPPDKFHKDDIVIYCNGCGY